MDMQFLVNKCGFLLSLEFMRGLELANSEAIGRYIARMYTITDKINSSIKEEGESDQLAREIIQHWVLEYGMLYVSLPKAFFENLESHRSELLQMCAAVEKLEEEENAIEKRQKPKGHQRQHPRTGRQWTPPTTGSSDCIVRGGKEEEKTQIS